MKRKTMLVVALFWVALAQQVFGRPMPLPPPPPEPYIPFIAMMVNFLTLTIVP